MDFLDDEAKKNFKVENELRENARFEVEIEI